MPRSNIKISHILLAVDDLTDRTEFRNAIESLNVDAYLKVYKNGQDLINGMLRKSGIEKPDIIFLDINMPIVSGFECLREIREIEEFLHVPIIVMYSNSISPIDKRISFDLGADLFISKPDSLENVKKVIAKVLKINWSKFKKDRDNFTIEP